MCINVHSCRVQKQLKQAKIEEEWIYVADSAAMTKDTLAQTKVANAFLITRGSSPLRIVKTALVEADAQDTLWSEPFSFAEKNGATYGGGKRHRRMRGIRFG